MAESSKKVSVTVRIKKSLLNDMKEVWQPKYGGKGRSRWVDEVVRDYLSNKRFFYHQSNFLDATDAYAYMFALEVKDEGSLNKRDEDAGIQISEKVKTKQAIEDPVATEKFALTSETIILLENAARNVSLMKSRVKINDPRGCIIRTAIEYGIVHSQGSTQTEIDL